METHKKGTRRGEDAEAASESPECEEEEPEGANGYRVSVLLRNPEELPVKAAKAMPLAPDAHVGGGLLLHLLSAIQKEANALTWRERAHGVELDEADAESQVLAHSVFSAAFRASPA